MGKQLQFELWQECNNHCKFCYNGDNNRFTSKENKLGAIKEAIAKISDLSNYPEYDTLAYLGGEFFQGQMADKEIHDAFMELMRITAWLKDNGWVKNVWIYCTLTIGDQKELYETLDLFKDKKNLWILTSWDTKGRFHNPKMFENWDYHMKNIHKLYPDILFNITTIITGDLCDKYVNGDFCFEDMRNEYYAQFFFKQPGRGSYTKNELQSIIPNFFPTRMQFLKFLQRFKEVEDNRMGSKLFNIVFRADTLYRNFNDKEGLTKNIRHKDGSVEVEAPDSDEVEVNPDCGHMRSYQCYIDSDRCCICDKIAMGLTND